MVLLPAVALGDWMSPLLRNLSNSAPAPNGAVCVSVDVTEAPYHWGELTATLFYSTDNQSSWQSVPMTLVGGEGYDSTYEAGFALPGSGVVHYYVRASNGTNYATGAPFNGTDSWPAPDCYMADFAPEEAGDAFNNPHGDYLDLTSAALGYSDGWFYSRLTNNSNSWPTSGGILGPWFAYSAGFANNDADSDTWGYSMTFVNLLGIYRTGFYELNKHTESFERIGDVEAYTSGNRLVMRCRLSDLIVRPHWGTWPIKSGCLKVVKAETRSGNASLQYVMHDTTFPAVYYIDRSPSFTIGANRVPVLSQAGVTPRTGDAATPFWFSVCYADPDTNPPVRRALVVDSDTFDLAAAHHCYWRTTAFDIRRGGFGPGWHRFHFTFSDGMAEVATQPDSFFVGTNAIVEIPAAIPEGIVASPNPFTDRVRLAFPRLARAIEIVDAAGRRVRTFGAPGADGSVSWDGTDETGRALSPGVFFLRESDGPLRRLLVKLGRR